MTERRINLPQMSRLAAVMPASINQASRTVELVWSTGADVTRMDWATGRPFVERLSMEPSAIRLERLNSGAPVLDSHRAYGTDNVIGVVERAWLADGEGRAVVRFAETPALEETWQKISQGVLRNVSVGYRIHQAEDISVRGDRTEIWLATDWEPQEISIVPIGADPAAGIRAADAQICVVTRRVEPGMTEGVETMPEAVVAPAVAGPPVDLVAERHAAVLADRERRAAIQEIASKHRFDAAWVEAQHGSGASLDAVRTTALDLLAARDAATPTGLPSASVGYSHDDPAAIRARMVDALVAEGAQRHGLTNPALGMTEQGREFAHMGTLDLMMEYCSRLGVRGANARMPNAAKYRFLLEQRGLSSSDFPLLLAAAANKTMMAMYEAAVPTYRLLAQKQTFNDFKAHRFLRGGDFPVPLPKSETGEFQLGVIGETQQQVVLGTNGRVVQLTRQMMINDDLSFFSSIPAQAARRFADWENAVFWTLLVSQSGAGPILDETGKALFHADHGNLAGTASPIDDASIGAGYAAMAVQRSIGDAASATPLVGATGTALNIKPKYLVVHPLRLGQARKFCTPVAPNAPGNVNPWAGMMEPITDGNIPAANSTNWWMFADPAAAPCFVYGGLNGAEGPQVATKEGFEVDGFSIRVFEDFVVSGTDFRGGYRNVGT
jgi:hypothetical protein